MPKMLNAFPKLQKFIKKKNAEFHNNMPTNKKKPTISLVYNHCFQPLRGFFPEQLVKPSQAMKFHIFLLNQNSHRGLTIFFVNYIRGHN